MKKLIIIGLLLFISGISSITNSTFADVIEDEMDGSGYSCTVTVNCTDGGSISCTGTIKCKRFSPSWVECDGNITYC